MSDLEALEAKSFEAAKGRSGQPAAQITFGKPKTGEDKLASEAFKIGELVARPTGQPYRVGFDSLPPAIAYATIVGLGRGAVVIKQDQFFFVAKVAAGAHPLNAYQGAEGQSTDAATRRVNYVDPDQSALAMTSTDCLVFPFRTYLITDSDQLASIGNDPFKPIDPKNPPKERVRVVEVEPGALARMGELLGNAEYPVYAAGLTPVTPDDGKPYLEAVSNSLSYGSRLWATDAFEMDEAAALLPVERPPS